MRDKKLHIDPSPEAFQRYFGNKMTGRERNAFERMLERDPFAAEAAEGYSGIRGEELKNDLDDLNKRLAGRKKRGIRWILYSSAAAAISVLIISTFFLKLEVPREKSLSERVMESEMKQEIAQPSVSREEEVENAVPSEKKGKGKEEVPPAGEKKKSLQKPGQQQMEKTSGQISEDKREEPAQSVPEEPDNESGSLAVTLNAKEAIDKGPEVITVKQEQIPALSPASRSKMAEMDAGGYVITTPTLADSQYPDRKYLINGLVLSSEDNQPLPGVSIMEKGTASGTVTDLCGRFQLNVDERDTQPVLVASFIGMKSEELNVSQHDTLVKIAMEPELLAMDEVVVIGYGTAQKNENVGAFTEIRPDDDEPPVYNPAEPVGGRKAFNEYIETNITFPEGYSDLDRGVVILKFTVSGNGRPVDIEVLKSPGQPFSDIAVRLLQNGPDWLPPTMDDLPVDTRQRLRLVFKRP